MKNHFLINTLSSFFYVGYIPGAPGTWASLLAVMIWLLLPVQSIVVQILIVSFAFLIGIYVSGLSEVNSGIVDPSFIVIDEVAGMWLALLLLPRLPYPHYLTIVLLAFVVFRILDITKIFPINKLEQMSGGFGIMMDDIAAGLLTAISINLIIWVI
ncbi:phosphatidylglycerophosphatase A [bacterium]|nr:phosphatidylglycerophosphatase A [bacterium]MBU1065244.1 phosphatidylglycerophosphatase A [bacterium]MBU1635496.1 phosphatidylglycerophosphatase A [bacterium]MBU1873785.1 phosphatidylglycerophosphatase A [bacterium]